MYGTDNKEGVMFEKEMIVSGVRRQRDLLDDLLDVLERKARLGDEEICYNEEVLRRVETSLRRIRKIVPVRSRIDWRTLPRP